MLSSLQTANKAIAGAIVTAIVAYLSQSGIVIDQDVSNAVIVIVSAVIGFVGIYFAPKNKPLKKK
jgi:multisubunit Na+/H+ antiporter MnhE subunit